MSKTILLATCFLVLLAGRANAQSCATLPYTLTNGTTADANQVMANFDSLGSCAAPLINGIVTSTGLSINNEYLTENGSYVGSEPPNVPNTYTTAAASYPNGFWSANLYNNSNYPSPYGYIFSMATTAIRNSMAQMYFSWNGYGDQTGTVGEPAYAWVRTNRDSYNQFGTFQQVVLLQQNGDLNLGGAGYDYYGSGNLHVSGKVGIGTTSPGSYQLYVSGSGYATGSFVNGSDRRLKKSIAPLADGALELVARLKPVSFEWKAPLDDGMRGRQTGFIAQEVESVLPSVVTTAANPEKTKGIKYNEIVAVLTKAVQELKNDKDELAHKLGQRSEALARDESELSQLNEKYRTLGVKVEELSRHLDASSAKVVNKTAMLGKGTRQTGAK